jgi:uncharacterized protein YxjI
MLTARFGEADVLRPSPESCLPFCLHGTDALPIWSSDSRSVAHFRSTSNQTTDLVKGEATMGLRDRVRRDAGSGVQKYQMREKLLSIGDDYWIENESGERAFKVNGKAARLRDTFVLEDVAGQEVAKIQERKLRVRDTMEIERPAGNATVHKALIGIRDRFKIDVEGGPDMTAHGNLLDHEYEIEADGNEVASVSKKWFRVRDSYGVEIEPGQDDALILAVTVCVDALTRE